ncbi:helix-turn-helix transcriptional regulator [Mycolicibacterium sp. S2-37]|uniref:helix-turn-helix transcriptional regulator n=1 Tax=Mycolicibacterium sp. S2-37 TaxID=2810297 RepID=UPI001A94C333|nr:helix-turn-helix transcriptional regulator [Mycolicibacterium sp. S2-37]MBO0676930.1 helix-turn-helix transcriptional regulator [Mycolicibacterium sp. S2-37]
MRGLNDIPTGAARPPGLRRSVEFIHDNADGNIGLAEIAAAANLTPRAVQYMFRRHLGVTPMEYLRRVRLDLAHRDLQAANPAVDTVNSIAGRWGFAHAGRFSVAYRRAYGTPPSATLRMARSRHDPKAVFGA